MGTIYRNGVPFVGSGGAGGVEMTQAEYDLLPTSEKMNGAIYFITDGDVSYPSASQMRYDNTESQIPSTTVQGAIDENRIEINDLKSGLMPSTYTAPTDIASGITLESGGYVLFGNLVVVNCRFNVTTAKSGTTAVATFPAPVSGNTKVTTANNKKLDMGIVPAGVLQTSENISTGALIVTTCYLKG